MLQNIDKTYSGQHRDPYSGQHRDPQMMKNVEKLEQIQIHLQQI